MTTSIGIEPLASYLKALGLLRVVNEQLDSGATGRWHNGRFVLNCSASPAELGMFLATAYRPSPAITPWNKDAGFFCGAVPKKVQQLRGERFVELQRVAQAAARLLPSFISKGKVDDKPKLLQTLATIDSDRFTAWLRVNAVLFTDSKGKLQARYPVLLGGSAGAFGRADLGSLFVDALQLATPEHFLAALYGLSSAAVLDAKASLAVFDPSGRGDAQQGYRVATTDVGKTTANPADLILAVEGLGFFDGYAATIGQDESGAGGQRQVLFTLAVSHNSAGHASATWLENDGALTEELWCPLWDEPVTFEDLRGALERVAALPLPRQLRTGTDFALFASRLGRDQGLSGFARYTFPPRVGQGMRIPSLLETFVLADQPDRTDSLALVVDFAWRLRMKAKDPSTSTSLRVCSERVVAEVEQLSGGGGSYSGLLRALVALRRQQTISTSCWALRYPELSSLWLDLLQVELDGPEWRIALACSRHHAAAPLADLALLLQAQLDIDLMDVLAEGLRWVLPQAPRPAPMPEELVPWLPADYVAGVLLHQWPVEEDAAVSRDRERWRELLQAERPAEAMAVALHRLRMAEVVSWHWPLISATAPQLLLRAARVPVSRQALRALRRSG
jgi:CRISPR-associated protein Csx17